MNGEYIIGIHLNWVVAQGRREFLFLLLYFFASVETGDQAYILKDLKEGREVYQG